MQPNNSFADMDQQPGYGQVSGPYAQNRNTMAQDQYAMQTKVQGVKQATLTEQIGHAHELVETLQKLLSGLETRLGPILSFAQPEAQTESGLACVEPPLIDEAGRLILRLRSFANRIDDIERRVRL